MAWIHLDPLYQLGGLTARMRQLQPGCWVEHEHEDELSAAVHSFLQDPSRSDDLVRTLTHTLGVGAGSQRHADPRVAKAVAMLGADPGEPISLGEISKRVGMSGSAFRRLFKAVTGVTFRRYRVWVRLKLAAELVHSGATFTEAAHEAGFASSAHLSFAYRNLCGVAPSVMLAVMKDGRRPCDIPAFASCQLDVSDELAQLVS